MRHGASKGRADGIAALRQEPELRPGRRGDRGCERTELGKGDVPLREGTEQHEAQVAGEQHLRDRS